MSSFSIELKERLENGFFVCRLNRFMVEVKVKGKSILAHLPNSGRLATVLAPNSKVFLLRRQGEKRKSCYDLFAVKRYGLPIIVDTRFSTFAAKTAIQHEWIDGLRDYKIVSENARVNGALLDFQLSQNNEKYFLEVKSVTHVKNNVAMFPDAPTQRGRKHVKTLISLKRRELNCGILFSVQRPDAIVLKPNYKIDPEFSKLLREASEKGVEIFTFSLIFKFPNEVEVKPNLPKFSF